MQLRKQTAGLGIGCRQLISIARMLMCASLLTFVFLLGVIKNTKLNAVRKLKQLKKYLMTVLLKNDLREKITLFTVHL